MKYKRDETVKGLNGYRFVTLNNTFWNLKNTSNNCYCVNTSRTLDGNVACLNDGLMDLTSCSGKLRLIIFK